MKRYLLIGLVTLVTPIKVSYSQAKKIPVDDIGIITYHQLYATDQLVDDEIVRGKVKSTKERIYDATWIDDKIVKGGIQDNGIHITYNATGKMISKRRFDENDGTVSEHTNQFDANGNHIQHLFKVFRKDYEFESRQEYIYDESKNWVEQKEYSNNVITSFFKFTYDGEGNIVKIVDKNLTSETTLNITITYNNGKPTLVVFTNELDTVVRKINYKYDLKGNILEISEFQRPNLKVPVARTVTAYNDKNKVTKREYFSNEFKALQVEYYYDKKGRLTEEVWKDASDNKSKFEYRYNDKNFVIEKLYYTDGALPSSIFVYTVDAYGNWTERITKTGSGEVTSYSEREVLYW